MAHQNKSNTMDNAREINSLTTASISVLVGIFFISLFWHWSLIDPSRIPYLGGNESAHFKTLVSIVYKGGFEIDPRKTDAACVNERCYSNKPPGYPIAMAPFFYIIQEFFPPTYNSIYLSAFKFACSFNAICSALTTVLIYLLLQRLTTDRSIALYGVVAAMLGTIYPAYATLATSHPLTILLILSALYLWVSRKEASNATLRLSLITMICCYSVTVDYSNFFFIIPFIAVVANQALRDPVQLATCVLSSWPIVALMIFHWNYFGGPFTPSYAFYISPRYVPWNGVHGSLDLERVPYGIWNYLFNPGRGMLILSPVTFLALLALFNRKLWTILAFPLLVALCGILFWSSYTLWHGGHSVGYRHILPAAMIFACFSCLFLVDANSIKRIFALLLLLLSCISGIFSNTIQTNRYLLSQTWKEEPYDVHANYYLELLLPSALHQFKQYFSSPEP